MRVTRDTQAAVAEAAWAVAARLGTFGYAEISAELKISMEQATRIVRAWVKGGAVDLVQSGVGKRSLWRVRPDQAPQVAVTPRGPNDNLWTAMRRLRSFTPTDLSAHATSGTVSVPVSDAADYCRALLAAGYLAVARKAAPDLRREAIYRLVKDTGPFPPRERRVRAVVDANTDQVIVIGGAT